MNDNKPTSSSAPSSIIRNRRNEALASLRSSAFRPRDIDPDKLKGMNHAEWLEDFSKILALKTPIEMTPKREGTITRLHWAAKYVRLLEQELRDAKVEIEKLQRSTTRPEAS